MLITADLTVRLLVTVIGNVSIIAPLQSNPTIIVESYYNSFTVALASLTYVGGKFLIETGKLPDYGIYGAGITATFSAMNSFNGGSISIISNEFGGYYTVAAGIFPVLSSYTDGSIN